MACVEITLGILEGIEKALDLGYDKLYVNVDDLDNGMGFLRVLAMKKSENTIVYEDTFSLEVCYQVLDLLERSKYDITDFTTRLREY